VGFPKSSTWEPANSFGSCPSTNSRPRLKKYSVADPVVAATLLEVVVSVVLVEPSVVVVEGGPCKRFNVSPAA
jgi:hypothetical protein